MPDDLSRIWTLNPERYFLASGMSDIPPPTWLLEDYLVMPGLSQLFGEWGTAKSFMALEMALHISTGSTWHGRKVSKRDVLYIAAEGHPAMLNRRLEAAAAEHGFAGVPDNLAVYADVIDLGNTPLLWELLDYSHEAFGLEPGFIVIDTLNMAMSGDEDSNNNMGALAKEMRKLQQYDYTKKGHPVDIHWMTVHHTGHEAKLRPRGGSAGPGAWDTILGMAYPQVFRGSKQVPEGEPRRVLFTYKQKDAAFAGPQMFEIVARSDEMGDAALRYVSQDQAVASFQEMALTGAAKTIHDFLSAQPDMWFFKEDLELNTGLASSTIDSAVRNLLEKGFINRVKDGKKMSYSAPAPASRPVLQPGEGDRMPEL